MREASGVDDSFFSVNPFPHIHAALSLFGRGIPPVIAKALVVLIVGWAPLVVLVILQSVFGREWLVTSFVKDFGVHARSLVGAPFFVFAEVVCLPRLTVIANNFVTSGILVGEERRHYERAVSSTRKLMGSTLMEVLGLIICGMAVALPIFYLPQFNLPHWYLPFPADQNGFSLAGWWYALVSLPVLLVLVLGWFWRAIVWARFLWLMANARLRLVAAHPDAAGGLKFLDASLTAYMPVAFTLGIVTAGSVANRVLHQGASIVQVQKSIYGLTALVLLLFVAPMVVFVFKLRFGKVDALVHYGTLAHEVGLEFEKKWLSGSTKVDQEALGVPDFSATTDLYQVVSNVYSMRALPFEVRTVLALLVSTLLPFVPVALMTIPLKVILQEIASLLF